MSRTKSTSTEVKEIQKLAAELKTQQKAIMDKAVELLKTLINKHDKIEGIAWSQYVPSFNDGDACEFTLGEIEFKIEGSKEYMDEYALEEWFNKQKDILDFKQKDKEAKPIKQILEQIGAVYDEFPALEGSLREAFGDNMKITLTRKGIETEDYDPGY